MRYIDLSCERTKTVIVTLALAFVFLPSWLPYFFENPRGGYESYYDEAWTKRLNEEAPRPNWKGQLPIYFIWRGETKSYAGNALMGEFGIGDPLKGNARPLGASGDKYSMDGGDPIGVVVVYDPATDKYKGYSWAANEGEYLKLIHIYNWVMAKSPDMANDNRWEKPVQAMRFTLEQMRYFKRI